MQLGRRLRRTTQSLITWPRKLIFDRAPPRTTESARSQGLATAVQLTQSAQSAAAVQRCASSSWVAGRSIRTIRIIRINSSESVSQSVGYRSEHGSRLGPHRQCECQTAMQCPPATSTEYLPSSFALLHVGRTLPVNKFNIKKHTCIT